MRLTGRQLTGRRREAGASDLILAAIVLPTILLLFAATVDLLRRPLGAGEVLSSLEAGASPGGADLDYLRERGFPLADTIFKASPNVMVRERVDLYSSPFNNPDADASSPYSLKNAGALRALAEAACAVAGRRISEAYFRRLARPGGAEFWVGFAVVVFDGSGAKLANTYTPTVQYTSSDLCAGEVPGARPLSELLSVSLPDFWEGVRSGLNENLAWSGSVYFPPTEAPKGAWPVLGQRPASYPDPARYLPGYWLVGVAAHRPGYFFKFFSGGAEGEPVSVTLLPFPLTNAAAVEAGG